MKYNKNIGNSGEEFAVIVLENSDYRIIERNFWSKLGEIDIIAVKNNELHFIEVKTRTQTRYGFPSEAVTRERQERMRRVAELYLKQRRGNWGAISLDVMEVSVNLIENCI